MAQAMTRFTVTPLPDRNNLLRALEMLINDDPAAEMFAKGVLKPFGAPALTEKKEQVRQLLQIWDNLVTPQSSNLSPDEQTIIDQARAVAA